MFLKKDIIFLPPNELFTCFLGLLLRFSWGGEDSRTSDVERCVVDLLGGLEGDNEALRLVFFIGEAFPNKISARTFRLEGTKILIEKIVV